MLDNNIQDYLANGFIIEVEKTVRELLDTLIRNKKQTIYVVASGRSKKCIGVVSYGDLVRWLSSNSNYLGEKIKDQLSLVNMNFAYVRHGTSELTLHDLLEKFGSIPILNDDKTIYKLIYAKKYNEQISIAGSLVSTKSKPFYIAEIGNNHNGDFELARDLVHAAKSSGANAIKFQARTKNLYKTGTTDLGSEYVNDLVSRFTLDITELEKLSEEARSIGLASIITPFDIEALEAINRSCWDAIKIASVDLVNFQLIQKCKGLSLPLILSTGMSSEQNIVDAYDLVSDHMPGFCFLHCNSTYPSPFSDVHLEFMETLKKIVGPMVGYSGHELGFHVANAAIVKGACIVEKHFTLDKNMIGNDHKVSLLPLEFKKMVILGHQIFEALGRERGPTRNISQGEKINKKTLGKSYIYKRNYECGDLLNASDIIQVPSSEGITPEHINSFLGKPFNRNVKKDNLVQESDFLENSNSAKLKLTTKFGVPVRFHDAVAAVKKIKPHFVEYHLSYSDVDRIDQINELPQSSLPFAVHAPEQFKDDFIINFADKTSIEYSTNLLNRVFEVTEKLAEKHKSGVLSNGVIPVILNVGGFSLENPKTEKEKNASLDVLTSSLLSLNVPKGVKILCQTMPPFPWLYGGSAFHNILTELSDVKKISKLAPEKIGICVDVSHTVMWLLNKGQYQIDKLYDYIKFADYLHIADVENERSEGLQIGHGLIDFTELGKIIREKDIPWLTEIWMGHANNFEGCLVSLKKLEDCGW